MLHNSTSESIIIKKLFINKEAQNIMERINITKFNIKSGTELIVNVICYSIFTEKKFKLYKPQIIKYEEPFEIKFNQQVIFDFENLTYFSFDYKGEKEQPIDISFKTEDNFHFRFFGNGIDQTNEIFYEDAHFTFILEEKGTYYIRIIPYSARSNKQRFFMVLLPSEPLDIIYLSQKYYNKSLSIIVNKTIGPLEIKVKDIQKDTGIIFDSYSENVFHRDEEFDSPFKICEENNNICKDKVLSYKFIRGKNYTIYLNIINFHYEYTYPSYYFFSVSDENIENNKIGLFPISEPKIYVYDLKNLGEINILLVNGRTILFHFLINYFL